MRSLFLAYTSACMLVACSFNATGLTATTNLTGEQDSTGASTTAASTTTDPTTGSGTGDVCSPGAPAPCACPFGDGQHTCNPDGNSYGPCDCPDDPTTSGSSTTAVDPDTSAGTSTSGLPDTTSSTSGDPDTSSTSDASTTSSSTSTAGDDTTASESSSGDDDSSTGAEMCKQTEMEPNAPAAMAVPQAEILCGQGKPGGMIMGVLDGDQDIDWWKYHGAYNSPSCNNTNPTHIYTLNADDTARLCVFADCDTGSGTATVMCSAGQPVADPDVPGGFGCCGMGNFQFEFNCDGTDDESSQVYMRLDGAKADSCVHYTVTYDYQDK